MLAGKTGHSLQEFVYPVLKELQQRNTPGPSAIYFNPLTTLTVVMFPTIWLCLLCCHLNPLFLVLFTRVVKNRCCFLLFSSSLYTWNYSIICTIPSSYLSNTLLKYFPNRSYFLISEHFYCSLVSLSLMVNIFWKWNALNCISL